MRRGRLQETAEARQTRQGEGRDFAARNASSGINMYFVYILYSEKDKGLYVGCTSNMDKRLKRHEAGHVPATAIRCLLVCIHTEIYQSTADAFNRERFLKTLWAARFKNKIKKTYLDNQNNV